MKTQAGIILSVLLGALIIVSQISCSPGGSDANPITTFDSTPPPTPSPTPSSTATPLASCPGDINTKIFGTSPVALSDVVAISPLGATGHVFPTDHIYIGLKSAGIPSLSVQTNLYAPGNLRITRVQRFTYDFINPSVSDYSDYHIDFRPCAQVDARFGHVSSITSALLAQIGTFSNCSTMAWTFQGEPLNFTTCTRDLLSIDVTEGTQLGAAGGNPYQTCLDFTTFDSRLPAIQFVDDLFYDTSYGTTTEFGPRHTTCAINYFTDPVRPNLEALLGSYDEDTQTFTASTWSPTCGDVNHDLTATAQGTWVHPSNPGSEDHGVALVRNNIDPLVPRLRVGSMLTGLSGGKYTYTPSPATCASDRINCDFSGITDMTKIYCLENIQAQEGSAVYPGVLLIQLVNNETLKLDPQNSASCAAAGGKDLWAFEGNVVTYNR